MKHFQNKLEAGESNQMGNGIEPNKRKERNSLTTLIALAIMVLVCVILIKLIVKWLS